MYNPNIQKFFDKGTADAIFLMKGANVRWASGFKGADSYLLATPERAFLITDPRYTEQAGIECPDIKAVNWREKGGVMKAAAKIIKELNLRRIAFEDDALTYQLYGALSKETDAELIPAAGEIEKLRSVKTAEEIQYLRAACDIACRAFYRILEDIRVGVTEKELASKLSAYMVFEGADTQPYGNILISGPNTSLLHGIPSDRALGYGDFVLMDYGCQFNGYMSDMTRTVVVGKATDEQKCVYALEKQMIEDSLAVMKAGADTGEVYRASIKAIENTEYFKYHYTGVGHGIGLFVHEHPFINPAGGSVNVPNTVTTIEPGLYIPGWGGVRIEDQVIIKENGNENLISVPHELIEV